MKLLNRGWDDQRWKKVVDCTGCGARLEIKQEDLKKTHAGSVDSPHFEVWVPCPQCDREILLSPQATGHESIPKVRDRRIGAGL